MSNPIMDHRGISILAAIILCFSVTIAQPSGNGERNDPYVGARVTPSMAIIIVVLITAMFFMGFFSLYIRRCSDENGGGSMRNMVAAVAGRSRRSRGLEPAALDALPVFAYSEVKGLKIGKGALECAVCLNEFEDDETLRLIPRCDHVFHSECIDVWFASHTTCPVCRGDVSSVEPDPDPAPESEVAVQVEGLEDPPPEQTRPVPAPAPVPGPARSWSIKPRFLFPRSHSTGHPPAHPDRFTLRLPNDVRNQLVKRSLNRASSLVLPRGEGSSRGRVHRFEPAVKSDRWAFSFFSRASSTRSPRVAAEVAATATSKEKATTSHSDQLPV